MADDDQAANKALLVGEMAGLLSWRLDVAIEVQEGTGDYTGRILIERPSGWWAVSVEKIEAPKNG